ncbi:MAG TPA: class I SAM-dependent methyltransferase [Acidimicrobiia bacterium]|nr:class I SAM-dependent methyltransferase [Acidimicrobiia bacterium]
MPPPLREVTEQFLGRGGPAVVAGLRALAAIDATAAAALPPLPYHDPRFSSRVLFQQLDQSTDQSSRRMSIIARQVAWLVDRLPTGSLRRVFHPLCGPGLFALALRARGAESYVGVDIGPAVVTFARKAFAADPAVVFRRSDALSHSPAGEPFSAALLTYEALNAFPPGPALALLMSIAAVLRPGGWLAVDVRMGESAPPADGRDWSYHRGGSVFAAGPHLLLDEWGPLGPPGIVAGHRFIVMEPRRAAPVAVLHSLVWSYPPAELEALLGGAGFELVTVEQPFVFDSDVAEAAAPVIALARRRG